LLLKEFKDKLKENLLDKDGNLKNAEEI